MKPVKRIIFALAFLVGGSVFAGNAELIKSMQRQQKAAEAEIIQMWSSNKRGAELEKVLSDYVVREVRLRSIMGTGKTGSLMGTAIKGGKVKFKSPAQLAQAIVLEDLRRKGIDKRPHYFVSGRYLIKGIEVVPGSVQVDVSSNEGKLIMTKNVQHWMVRLVALAAGAIAALAISNVGPLHLVQTVYDKVGITVVALAPLSIWGLWTAMRHSGDADLTLSYIGTTAQRIGLLGTVIGIVAATIRIGDSLNGGAAGAVSGALPAVGQALISTAVGFVIALGCDFVRYLQERNNKQETAHVGSTENLV